MKNYQYYEIRKGAGNIRTTTTSTLSGLRMVLNSTWCNLCPNPIRAAYSHYFIILQNNCRIVGGRPKGVSS